MGNMTSGVRGLSSRLSVRHNDVVAETDAAWSTRHTPPEWFGAWLAGFRRRVGWSLRVAERHTGVSAGHLCKMENGLRCPSTSVAYDIAHAYRMRGEDLDTLLSVAVSGAGRDYVPSD
jgi:hypothetical protein